MGDQAHSTGAEVLRADGYRFVAPVPVGPADIDGQGHLNNAAVARLFNDLRIAYITHGVGPRWGEYLRRERRVVAAKEVHLLYESEGFPHESFLGAMRYTRRDGRAAIVEQRMVEAATGRSVARAWVVQLLAAQGRAVEWPGFFFDLVAVVEGHEIEHRPAGARPAWGPPA